MHVSPHAVGRRRLLVAPSKGTPPTRVKLLSLGAVNHVPPVDGRGRPQLPDAPITPVCGSVLHERKPAPPPAAGPASRR